MGDPIPVERREVIEERANRDAFWICLALIGVMIAALTVAGILACQARVILYPLMPKAPAAQKTFAFEAQPTAACASSRLSRDGHQPVAGKTPAGGFSFPSRRVQS